MINISGLDLTQEAAAHNPTSETISDVMKLKADILEIRRATVPQLGVLRSLIRGHTDIVETGLSVYFRSVCDHLEHVNGQLDTFREEVNSTIQVSLAVKQDQMNEVMKVLAVIAVIFAPLTFITGVFGMNFLMPGPMKSAWMWVVSSVVMAVLGVALWLLFRKKRWL